MPPNLQTTRRGNTFTVVLAGPLDERLASGHFSRLLASSSGADELILDVRDVDSVRDSGLAALRLLRHRAHQAGKRLTVVTHDSAAQGERTAREGAAIEPGRDVHRA